MIFSAIDIGSNAVRLMFANVFEEKEKVIVQKATLIRIPIRLGKDVYKNNTISEKRGGNLLKTMKAFKLLLDVYKPVDYVACATAAMREATNGPQIIEKIEKEAGVKIKTITGLEEAEIIRSTSGFQLPEGKTKTMFIDLGGGSIEISVLSDSKMIDARSFKIGTLRILNNKVPHGEWDEMSEWLMGFNDDFGKINVIGSGGNINKITKLFGDSSKGILSYQDLEYATNYLKSFTLQQRIKELGLRPDRADVIVPASEVFIFITKLIRAESMLVPKIGLADGLIHNLYLSHKKEKKSKAKSKAK
jgi:exopolyphosphatase/guanosine-5'-triphosphate,3'-diphosphate pyrophosphatase